MLDFFKRRGAAAREKINVVSARQKSVEDYSNYLHDAFSVLWDGDKYQGHFGLTKDYTFVDYWTLRERSLQLFTENPYCRGIIRRILRNEIFTGIVPEATPIANVLWPDMDGVKREELAQEFGERMTNAFNLYSNNYEIFDSKKQLTFGEWQQQVRMESLLCGDGIIVNTINAVTGLPSWDWINGKYVRSPIGDVHLSEGHEIKNGVELDAGGRHVAYYVQTVQNGEICSRRIPVKGKKSGRQIAWMVYGSEKLLTSVRGEPLLASVLGILKELDRYRDAEERAAVVNAMLAFFVKKSPSVSVGTRPTAGFASLRSMDKGISGSAVEETAPRQPINIMNPGTVIDDMAPGEEIQSFQTNRPNVNYAAFESAILDAVCWSIEIPPEIARMKFQSSYSASRQANNEFDVYLKYRTYKNAKDFCQIVYEEFILQSCLSGQLEIPGLLTDCFDVTKWQKKAAWLNCSWTGLSRPAVDRQKDVAASEKALDCGLTTYDIEARRTSGLSFRQVMARLKRERAIMSDVGFVPRMDEDNNGKPAYGATQTAVLDEE